MNADNAFIAKVEKCRLTISTDFKLKAPVCSLDRYLRCKRRCLFLAKGPSLDKVGGYLDYGHIATVNEACLKVNRPIEYAFFFDRVAVVNAKPAWGRIRCFVMPARLFSKRPRSTPIDEIRGLPLRRVLTFYDSQQERDPEAIRSRISQGQVAFVDTAVTGLQVLVLLGYAEIFLLGHDGGVGYAKGMPCLSEVRDMSAFRHTIEFVASLLREKYAVSITFYESGS